MTTVNLGNVGDLFKPVDTLIKKIAGAAGVWWAPKQVERLALAQAKADMIREIAKIDIEAIKELHERTGKRLLYEELMKQNNMELIIEQAIPAVGDKAKPENVEDDWIANFFDKCRLTSDEQMQELWAKILAGEANSPGKFSKKTVNIVANLDKSDAEAFTRLCGFGFSISHSFEILIYDIEDKIYTGHGITFDTISNLESVGLIQFNPLTNYRLVIRLVIPSDRGFTQYFDQRLWLEFPQGKKTEVNTGHVFLTQAGRQLASLCEAGPVDGFIDYVKEKWKGLGYKTEPEATIGTG
jgi:hypothetical protein